MKTYSYHCLVVSKDRLFVDLLESAVDHYGIGVSPCRSGLEARAEIARKKFDLILVNDEPGVLAELHIELSPFPSKWIVLVEDDAARQVQLPAEVITFSKTAPLGELLLAIRGCLGVPEPSGNAGAGIIVTDDDEAVRRFLTAVLQKRGYQVTGAENAAAALALAQDEKFKIMILDVNMPGVGGLDVLAELIRRRTHLGIIMLSGIADSQIAAYALKAGAFDYILKPFNPAAIESSISACLSHLQYRDRPWWRIAQ